MDKSIILEARNIVKNFPGVRALDGVQFQLQKGEVHALVGENGAGKSTLMHILGGVYRPDSGDVFVEGKKVKLQNPYHASQEGISVVYQELSLVQNLSIAENIFANRQPLKRMKLVDWSLLYQKTLEILKYFDLVIDPRTPVKELSVAQQQVVEILKAISCNPKVLILDEPTSSLTQVETKLLFKNIQFLKEKGVSFVYISHHLQEIFEIADRVTIFRDGKYIDTRNISEVNEEQVVKLMVGREIQNMYGDRNSKVGKEYFQVENLSQDGVFTEISFSLKRGEILGIAGLVGAGRTELARAIFGLEPFSEGSIRLNGKVLSIHSPGDAIQEGIAYLTEDRKQQGLFLKMSYREDLIAPDMKRFIKGMNILDESKITSFAEQSRKQFKIITPTIFQKVRNLSGGNQQKVLLSMWVGINPKVLIVDEPTRGVDVGARREIYKIIRDLTLSGVGIVMISSDLPEVLGVSDRILVMRGGRIVGEFNQNEATEERVITCATGVGKVNMLT